MCGIVGILSFQKENTEGQYIPEMTDRIVHRGPDNNGRFSDGQVHFGHRRLSIIDLSREAHQPMTTEDGAFTITYNGEIYNFLDLRRELKSLGVVFRTNSDTEVILEVYRRYRYDTPKKLRGMFAFAIWDKQREELFLARDRVGQKPLKFYRDEQRLIFASELKAILTHPEVPRKIDYIAIDQFLTYKYVPAPRTGFSRIQKLEPAHYLIISKSGKITKQRYWDLAYLPKQEHTEDEWKKLVEVKLRETISSQLVADVPVGAHLSGGIDSSLVVAMASSQRNSPLETFSIGFEEETFDELPYARQVADRYHTKHREYVMRPEATRIIDEIARAYEEPYADASAVPSWYLAKITAEDIKVVLNGDGGDESFAGYDRYQAARLHRLLHLVPYKGVGVALAGWCYRQTGRQSFRRIERLLRSYDERLPDFFRNLISYVSETEKHRLYTDTFRLQLTEQDRHLHDAFKAAEDLGWLDQLLSVGVHTHLPDDLLVKVDIASMAHSLEARSPMLDHEFLELVATMPEKYKLKGNRGKYILTEIARAYLPAECIDRPKQGFTVPIGEWLRGELRLRSEKKLTDGTLSSIGIDEGRIEILFEEHVKGSDHTDTLFALLMLREWLGSWFETL